MMKPEPSFPNGKGREYFSKPLGSRPKTHTCPVAGCPVRLPQEFLMCKPHWTLLPPGLRVRVNAAWQAWNDGKCSWEQYLEIRQEAIDYHDRGVRR